MAAPLHINSVTFNNTRWVLKTNKYPFERNYMKLDELFEMATPTKEHGKIKYFHGSNDELAAEKIIKDGFLKPRDLEISDKKLKGPTLEPVKGKVYLTPSLSYAQIYAIGGNLAGSNYISRKQYGYLFQINGKELTDIQPDEDSVGELIHNELHTPQKPFLNTYVNIARRQLTARQFKELENGEYVMWAHAGKKLLKTMSDFDKLKFIELGAHIAHTGNIKIEKAWKIDLTLISKLKPDGSNFFELAERIPV